MENSRSRSPRRKHRSRKSHSRSRSRRDTRRRSGSKEEKHKHKKSERIYESPFTMTDIYFSSTLAGLNLTKVIKKDFPKLLDIDDIKNTKKKPLTNDTGMMFISPQAEEACRKILKRLDTK
ncbi:hypothetical protein SteCoe_9848 [Stentor coeruleus]|uniref:Uncharacterized protein n=1 Tax=Stentor coeruleus TaxID=5963 RepID=A0A1R2CGX3_9CILI|nr:hypothetical protein SteCoe_9848 [Stentor coeruleus]